MEKYKMNVMWGYNPLTLIIFALMLPFVLFSKIIEFNPLSYIFGMLSVSLIMGIIFGSKITFVKDKTKGESK